MALIRNIIESDYINYIKLIDSNISEKNYNDFINNTLSEYHVILVIELDDTIIGTGTLIIEKKMTYGGCKMGHIENILIDEKFRGKGYVEKLMEELLSISKKKKCYRVDLNCNSELKHFYEKNGFNEKHICMNIYFKENFNQKE
jgi:glucosamine-phosphate N-acetyltransferase